MFTTTWLRAAARCGTGLAATILVGTAVDADDAWPSVQQLKYAALTSEKSVDSAATTGSYTVDDSAALQRIFDAGGPTETNADEFAPSGLQQTHAQFEPVHLDLGKYVQSPEAKAYPAWEFQEGKVVPEPSTMLLVGFGLAAFAALRNKSGRATR